MESATGFWIATGCAVISAVAITVQAIYAALGWHRPPQQGVPMVGPLADIIQARRPVTSRRFWIMAAFPLLAWLAVGFDYWDRHQSETVIVPVISWGAQAPPAGTPVSFFMNFNSGPIVGYRDKYRLMLIVRGNFSNVDELTDHALEKSDFYTITGETMMVAVIAQGHMRVMVGSSPFMEYLVMIPNDVQASDVTCLKDVSRLGGKTVGVGGSFLPVSATPPLPAPAH